MANTPTDQRNLYHATAKRRISTIDRSIEQAITMFAPGTITTKDKQKHLAIGITGNIPLTMDKEQQIKKFLTLGHGEIISQLIQELMH